MLLLACSGEEAQPKIAKGGAVYGGELRFMSTEKVEKLFPLASEDVYEQRMNNQIFETLLKIDQNDSEVVPALAESYSVSKDAKTYTFQIRKGVFFHDDPCFSGNDGRELTADDIKFSLELACSGLPENRVGNLFLNKIKGAKAFHAATKYDLNDQSVSGIVVKDKNTLEINLESPFVGFDKMLTHSNLGVFPKEAYEKYGSAISKHPVGTGPFKLDSWNEKGIVLTRNPTYWRKDNYGNSLPFLDQVVLTYAKSKKAELLAFRKSNIDLILKIPANEIENTLGTLKEAQEGKTVKHKVDSRNSLSLTYFGLNNGVAPFSDKNVRQAFNLAVNRVELVNTWLKGEGYPVINGFVPALSDYPSNKVNGFSHNVLEAQQALAKAGFPNGAGFPTLDIYVNTEAGSSTYQLVKGFQAQLKQHLNIDLNIKLCTLKERGAAIKSGKALIWISGWIADYPDPQNFLDLFYSGKNSAMEKNQFQFVNPTFNRLLEEAMKEKSVSKRTDLWVKCDQMIVNEAVVIPIYNDDFITMVNAKVRNFKTNSMEILDFSTIFIREPQK